MSQINFLCAHIKRFEQKKNNLKYFLSCLTHTRNRREQVFFLSINFYWITNWQGGTWKFIIYFKIKKYIVQKGCVHFKKLKK